VHACFNDDAQKPSASLNYQQLSVSLKQSKRSVASLPGMNGEGRGGESTKSKGLNSEPSGVNY
jgi:hypothetical protein